MKKPILIALIIVGVLLLIATSFLIYINYSSIPLNAVPFPSKKLIDIILPEQKFSAKLENPSSTINLGEEAIYNLTIIDYHSKSTDNYEYKIYFEDNSYLNGEFYYDFPDDGLPRVAVVSSQIITKFLGSGETIQVRLGVRAKTSNVTPGAYKFYIKINEANSLKYQTIEGSITIN